MKSLLKNLFSRQVNARDGLSGTGTLHKPKLSIVVNFYNMRRQAEKTLHSLSSSYQQEVSEDDYEVIAVDNGSSNPLDEAFVKKHGGNFHYLYHETTSPSPVQAVNKAASLARGENTAIIVDGARMVSPGLIGTCINALRCHDNPVVCALAWHLGPDIQRLAIEKGYNEAEEDRLLDSINWPQNGERLFEISTIAPSSADGFLGDLPTEASFIAMRTEKYQRMGGLNPAFNSPGGGLVCLDFLKRAVEEPDTQAINILGEGTFHQIHGGIATNSKKGQHPIGSFHEEYEKIVGAPYTGPNIDKPMVFGKMAPNIKPFLFRKT